MHISRDPPTTPPPPPPSETDPYFNAFSRHYSFSVKHSQTRNKISGSVTPSTSPKKVAPPRICSRSTSFSVSSNSSHSSMSSLGSSLGSPSVESFPQPPTPLLSPGYSGDLQSEPLPPPPFPGAVPTLPNAGNNPPPPLLCDLYNLGSWRRCSRKGKVFLAALPLTQLSIAFKRNRQLRRLSYLRNRYLEYYPSQMR